MLRILKRHNCPPSFKMTQGTSHSNNDVINPSIDIPVYLLNSIFIVDTIMVIFGILGNFMVILTVLCCQNRSKITTIFLLNISIVNLLHLGLSYPIWTMQTILGYKVTLIATLYTFLPPFSDILSAVIMLSLAKLAIIRHNMIYRSSTGEPNVNPTINIICIWCASVVLILIPRLLDKLGIFSNAEFRFIYTVLIGALWYMTPLSLTVGSYISTKMFLKNQFASEWFKGSGHTALVKNQVIRCKTTHRILGPVVIMSSLMFFPLFIYPLLSLFAESYLMPYQLIYSLIAVTCIVTASFLYPMFIYKLSRDFKINVYGLCYTIKKKLRPIRSYNISNPDIYQRRRLLSYSSSSNASNSFIYLPHIKTKPFRWEETYELNGNGGIFDERTTFQYDVFYLRETVL